MGALIEVGATYPVVGIDIFGTGRFIKKFDQARALVTSETVVIVFVRNGRGGGLMRPLNDDEFTASLDFDDVLVECTISGSDGGGMALTVNSLL